MCRIICVSCVMRGWSKGFAKDSVSAIGCLRLSSAITEKAGNRPLSWAVAVSAFRTGFSPLGSKPKRFYLAQGIHERLASSRLYRPKPNRAQDLAPSLYIVAVHIA
ncbi:hypothetical protein COMA2_50040 [Candidatus Nitrospira nitrificans]|uniref:Uncharacterized protein n=1 Tax=Candidatus Nitrospira nitrificans TaxID=1742973 RepID=A0A0S4LLE2_9BACT|nr:hypothetical protein COMA2_50040 [Candidatus Nitrospira nitrificans]